MDLKLLTTLCILILSTFISCQTTDKPAYSAQCLSGFSQTYIESCETACGCEWGYCKKCCQLVSGQCKSHDPIGWTVAGACKACPAGYTLDALSTVPCNSNCKIFLDAPSATPSCCNAVPTSPGSNSYTCYTQAPIACPTATPTITTTTAAAALPTSFTFKSISPILNQASCGDCYAFSAAGSFSDRYNALTGSNVVFSPQPYTTCGQPSGCSGGDPYKVLSWHLTQGITTCDSKCFGGCHPFFSSNGYPSPTATPACPTGYQETATGIPSWCATAAGCDPTTFKCPTNCIKYSSTTGSCGWATKTISAPLYSPCLNNPNITGTGNSPAKKCQDGSAVNATNFLSSFSGYTAQYYSSSASIISSANAWVTVKKPASIIETQLKREIYLRGSIASCYIVKNQFSPFFSSNPTGVYNATTWSSDSSTGSGHCVRTVGWGVHASGMKYWYTANSWGTGWGDKGFFRIQRGADVAGYETRNTAFVLSSTMPKSHIMEPASTPTTPAVPAGTAVLQPPVKEGGGEWENDDNENEGYDAIDFLMSRPDALSNVDKKPTSNTQEIVAVNNVQKQVVAGGYQVRVDFDTKSGDNDFYNHANIIRITEQGKERMGRPVSCPIVYGPALPREGGRTPWSDRPGLWGPWARNENRRVYHFLDGEVRVEIIPKSKSYVPMVAGLVSVFGLVIASAVFIYRRRHRQQDDDSFTEMIA